ncbi:hypothetical protein ACOSQ4_020360 [Xanthoceras sorbifolium]
MIPDVFKKGGPVNVRGRQVGISVESKNEYFGLEDVNHMGGHADDPVVTLYNEELVKDLQRSRKGSWLSSRAVLTTEELHFDSALWNEFCLYSLFPNENGGMVSPDMAYVLYSIRHNLPINIGFLIRQQIADIGNSGLDLRVYYRHHRVWTGAGIMYLLSNDMSLNCCCMAINSTAEFDVGLTMWLLREDILHWRLTMRTFHGVHRLQIILICEWIGWGGVRPKKDWINSKRE